MTPDIGLILGIDGIATGSIYVLVGLGPRSHLLRHARRLRSVRRHRRVLRADARFAPARPHARHGLSGRHAWRSWPASWTAFTIGAAASRTASDGGSSATALCRLFRLRSPGCLPARACRTAAQIPLAIALVVPIAPLIERIALRPLADASVLLLLIVSVALTFALSGLGLLFFGAGRIPYQAADQRGVPLRQRDRHLADAADGGDRRRVQPAAVLVLRTHARRARHCARRRSIASARVSSASVREAPGTLAFLLASLLGAISGILIGPVTTLYYDSGFIIGLKAFVGAIIGGLVSYPGTAIGAILDRPP